MLSRWHIIFGAVFTLFLGVMIPGLKTFYLGLVFFTSFLVAFDHLRTTNQKRSSKSEFYFFHTLEVIAVTGLISVFSTPFFFVFIGFVFHTTIDIVESFKNNTFNKREFFLFKWISGKD